MDYNPFFTVKVTNRSKDRVVLGKSDGTFEELPEGIGLAGRISGISAEYVYSDIINLLNIFNEIKNVDSRNIERYDQIIKALKIEDNNNDKSITWNNRIYKIQHKLESLKYHMDNFKRHETEMENKYKNEYTNTITDFEELDPVFTYETEAFLFQTKSALDILSQTIGLALKLNGVVTYGNDGKDLIYKINKTSSFRNFQSEKNQLIEIIQNNIQWISYFVNMRDLITHFSDLIKFQSNIHEATFAEYANIYYPQMPDGTRVTQFMDDTWNKLVLLVGSIGNVLQAMYQKVQFK